MRALSSAVAVATCVSNESILGIEPAVARPTPSSHCVSFCPQLSTCLEVPRGGEQSKDQDEDTDDNDPQSQKKKQSKKRRPRTKDDQDPNRHKQPQQHSVEDTPTTSNPIVDNVLKHEDFYQILGVSRGSSDTQIKKAYRKRAVQTHPDKTGGDRRAFDKVAEAYDALSDPSKKQVYDRFGKAGLESGGGAAGMSSGSSYHDLFRNMFHQQQARSRRNRTMRYQLQVSLEELYHGKTQSVVVTPPMGRAGGKEKEVEVVIPRGSRSGQSIVLSGEMDFIEDDTPGDIVFLLTQAPHPVFTRKGHDLALELTISLEEAVCGVQREIKHLDGTDVWVQSARSSKDIPLVIQTGDVQVLKGRGMPKRNKGVDEFGDLYIQYRVEMPKPKGGTPLSADELVELRRLLSKLQGSSSREIPTKHDIPFMTLETALTSDFGRASGSIEMEDGGSQDDAHLGEEFHPFSSFFQGGTGSGGNFYFGSRSFGEGHPFGDTEAYNDNDGNVQCQQM